ncbi:MAG TPA: 50S ribosomal protein L9 [Candidatus Binataceae bacterium]|nr:50S ribosomal protein L9 [Candidatus Binataceae bacterium]
MQIILREDIPNLGRPGDVVKVRDGYARNFLLPRNLAIEANPKNMRAFEHQKRLALMRREAKKTEALRLKERLEALRINLTARAGEEGKLFGSVTNIDIERSLREQNMEIERRKILLTEPIKQLGDYNVPIKIDPEVEAILKITVAAE